MRHLHFSHKESYLAIFLIFIVLLGTFPIHLALLTHTEEPVVDKQAKIALLEGNGNSVKVPRLRKTLNISSKTPPHSLLYTPQEYQNSLNLGIGSESGLGGGDFIVNDSLIITNLEQLSLADTHSNPEVHDDEFTITIPGGFENNSGSFNISNITPLYDWRHVENDRVGGFTIDSTNGNYDAIEAAMEFNIVEEYAALNSIRVITEYETYENITDIYDPTGKIFIVNSTWETVPYGHWKPNPNDVLSSVEDILRLTSWRQYIFDSDVILWGNRSYYVVFNDTSTTPAYWRWAAQKDSGANGDDNDEGEFYFKYQTHSSLWIRGEALTALDLNLRIEVKPIQYNGTHFIDRKFTQPAEMALLYNTSIDETSLTRFDWFDWNGTADNIHRFSTNTSVSFDLYWNVNVSYFNNPLSAFAYYFASNNSYTQWNLTFSTTSITTSYNIRNRTIFVKGLQDDWNGSFISHGSIMQYNTTPSGGFNTSVNYSNQSSLMIINASALSAVTNWNITFDAPNYVLGFNISEEGIPLALPYQTFTMNDYNLDFEVGETGNLTYWIYYPNGSELLRKNINDSYTVFSHPWDINSTFDNISDVNGTYNVKAFWNNSDLTKVGLYTRYTDMIVNSTFDYEYEAEVILDTHLDIIVYYNSTHNATIINNASVSGVPSWGTTPVIDFNHTVAHDPYTFAIEINNSQHTPGDIISVDISAELPGYVNYSTTINVKVVSDATLSTNISQDFVLEWRENKSIEVQYNDTGGSGIKEAIIAVDGDSTNVYNISDVYYYRFNSTNPKYGGVSSHLDLNITASHTNYLTKIWIFNLTITLGETNITATIDGDGAVYNDTLGTQIYYADSSADHVSILLRYYHNITDDDLSTLATIDIIPIPIIPILDSKEGPSSTWNITFDPDQVNQFVIEITFSLTNYEDATFIFHLEVLNAKTRLQTEYQNNTNVYYAESYDFFLLYNNTNYNENITGLIEGSGFTINNSKVDDLNQTNQGYWFRFNPSPSILLLGRHSINITFSHVYFNPSFIEVTFIVVSMPTIPLNITNFRYNQSILVEDVLYIGGEGYQTIRGQNISNLTVVLWMNDTLVIESLYDFKESQNWFAINFTTTSFHYGNYSLTLEIGKVGYQNQTINFNITLQGRKTILEVTLPGKKFEQGDLIEITAIITYVQEITGGLGAGLSLAPLEAVNVSFYIELKYEDETTRILEITNQTDDLGQTSFIIDSKYTLGAVGFTNITVWSGPALSGLPSSYSMSAEELGEYQIIKIINPIDIIIPVIIIGSILLLIVGAVAGSGIVLNRKRKQRSELIQRKRRKIEQSFEDIKSIRLLIARHESGLQFYSENTIADVKTDTDALSGMSTALSSFMKELSDGMSPSSEERERDKIEVMSREGLHMLVWHGELSSFIIISEMRLPDYFQDRLKKLGQEVETTFVQELKDFYSADQIPSNQVKKLVRKHIPLHYFSAFILNEGVLTLESIKLKSDEKKMLKLMKEIRFQKEGIQFFFSEQIISHLSKHYNRSKTIKFLDLAIEINLLVEASQEEILSITR